MRQGNWYSIRSSRNEHNILTICMDCGDTLIDEETEKRTEEGISLRAELIPGAAELMHELKAISVSQEGAGL